MLKVGIVGLPNAGKSSLFNALVKGNQAEAANFPFTTIEPNVGMVEVPDERLTELANLVHPQKIVPAAIEFVDIAGLVEGAHKGEGLGNKFLSHIKEADAIVLVLRNFTDGNVTHIYGSVDPVRDFETLMLELVMSDLSVVSSAYERAERNSHDSRPATKQRAAIIKELKTWLEQNKPINEHPSIMNSESDEVRLILQELQLLTAKKRLLVLNVNEDQTTTIPTKILARGQQISPDWHDDNVLTISSKLEAEIINLPEAEQAEFLASYHLSEPGLHRLIKQAYHALNLQSFLTAGPLEVRAWTIPFHTNAQTAAGVIHTDFAERFIKAEVISYADYVACGGETAAREAGKLRSEGKDYLVQDGDVMHFRFSPK